MRANHPDMTTLGSSNDGPNQFRRQCDCLALGIQGHAAFAAPLRQHG